MAKDVKEAGGAPAAATKDATYVLITPIQYNGERVTDIEYRRPKGRDVRKAFKVRNAGGDMYLALLEAICEQTQDLFDELDGTDYVALVSLCDDFLEPPKPSKAA